MSSELLAREMGLGPVCDNCHMFLGAHGTTMAGAVCDLELNLRDVARPISELFTRLLTALADTTKGTQ